MENEISSLKTENKELLSRVKRLEAGSSKNGGVTGALHSHPVHKREIDNKKTAAHLNRCANSANLCTFYYPNHADLKGNINGRNNSYVVQSATNNSLKGVNHGHPVHKREIENKKTAAQLNRCANSANLCTFYYPDQSTMPI